MEVGDKMEMFNPWKVDNLDQFLNYCCPECDSKQKSKADFIIHAIDAHPNSREFLPLFDFETDKDDTFEPLKSEFSSSNNVSVKLEPISKMECDEENCGRFFVTEESMLEHKRNFHQKKSSRKVKKPKKSNLDYEDVIEPSEYLETNVEYETSELIDFEKENNDFEPTEDFIDFIEEDDKEELQKKIKKVKKRKVTDSDDEYGKPKKKPKRVKTRGVGRPSTSKFKHLLVIDPLDGIQKYKCDLCGLTYKGLPGIMSHVKLMHPTDQKVENCVLCSLTIPSLKLKSHMLLHHRKDGIYKCDWCPKQFKDTSVFLCHLTKEHEIGEFRHKCDQCDKVFDLKTQLRRHMKIRHEKACTVICEQCGDEFLTKKNLDNHMKSIHHMYKITKELAIKKCDKCDLEFEKPEEFNDHLKQCLEELKDFKCKLCDTRWVSHLSLSQHIAVDHQLIQHVCDICGLATTTAVSLKAHKKHIHDKIYDYVCHICAQPKISKRLLDIHMVNAHGIGERKYKCDKCDKTFAKKSILDSHYQSHHARKTLYQCEQCPKTFWMKSYLSTHVRMIHDKIRPNKCDICQEGFYYKRDLVSHKKHVHNIYE